jgi:D-sedoheptulose 7-phosphate isomerase
VARRIGRPLRKIKKYISMDNIDIIRAELGQASAVLNLFLNDTDQLKNIDRAAEMIASCFDNGGKVISCGNGGSHCDAMHFAEELSGRFRDDRRPLAAISISDPSYISCVANDFGFDQIFSRAIEGLGKEGDVILAISTSGNSQNILNALNSARKIGIKSVVLTGNTGGKIRGKGDVEILVPHSGYADRIQEVHIKIIHILIHLIEKQLG